MGWIRAMWMLLMLAILSGCAQTDYTNPDNVDIKSFEPAGQAEVRVIARDARVVRNCPIASVTAGEGSSGCGLSAVTLKEPLEVGAASDVGIEWTVGSEQGQGFGVKAAPMPIAIDLTRVMDLATLKQIKSTTAARETRDLIAEPNSVVEYSYQVSEIWQPGYVEVTFKYLRVVRIEVRYRSGVRLEITGQKSRPCPTD